MCWISVFYAEFLRAEATNLATQSRDNEQNLIQNQTTICALTTTNIPSTQVYLVSTWSVYLNQCSVIPVNQKEILISLNPQKETKWGWFSQKNRQVLIIGILRPRHSKTKVSYDVLWQKIIDLNLKIV